VLTGIAGGTDGKLLTLMNVHTTATVTLSHNSGSSLAANRIATGLAGGASMQIGPGQSVQLMYDGAASLWRVISGAGGTGATTYVTQTLATSSVSYIPQLMDASSQFGNAGMAFIYRNQIYTMGAGAGAPGVAPYGLNDTTTNNAFTPSLLSIAATTSAPNGPSGWSAVTGNNQTACALSNVGTVYCWGLGTTGQTGNGTNATNYTAIPITFPAPASSIVKIFTSTDSIYAPGGGTNSFFAIDSAGRVFGWGGGHVRGEMATYLRQE
jgi:hypothetical protein